MNKSNLNIKNKTPESVVEVKDLKVQFQLKDKVVKAVDGISFNTVSYTHLTLPTINWV